MARLGTLIKLVEDIIDIDASYRECSHLSDFHPTSCKRKCILNIINQLADLGSSLNIQDTYGNTPLFYALQFGCSKDAVIRFIETGADVNITNNSGSTPLLYALKFDRDIEIVFKLLEHGANVNIKDESGMTPLMCAMMQKCPRQVILRLIYETSDMNSVDQAGRTALLYALGSQDEDIIYRIIDCGAHTTTIDSDGNTLLHLASGSTWACISTFLFNHGISVNLKNNNGETPLFSAAKFGDRRKVQTLLSFGGDLNICDNHGRTPLHVVRGEDCINHLIYYGVNLKAKDKNNLTPLDLHSLNKNGESVKCIVKHYLLLSEKIIFHESASELFMMNSSFSYLNNFILECTKEVDEMKLWKITSNLSFYDFCKLKRTDRCKIVNISKSEYLHKFEEIFEKFPNYFNIILLRIRKNENEKQRYNLIKCFTQINIETHLSVDSKYSVQMDYDSFEYVARYLSQSDIFNLFLASL